MQQIPRFMLRFPAAPIFWVALILLLPLVLEITYSDFVREGEYNSRIGWTFILTTLVYVIKKRPWIFLLLLPFTIGGSLDIGYAVSFGGVFTTATIEAVAYTDSSEAGEFIAAYSSLTLIFWLLLYWGIFAAAVARMSPESDSGTRKRKTIVVLGAVLMLTVTYRTTAMGRFHDTIPGVLGSMPSYLQNSVSLQQEFDLRKQMLDNSAVKVTSNNDEPQTHIFIIGESATRNHMSLYRYPRQTTPFLESMAEQLAVFDNVVSSHAQTQASLRVALTAATAAQGDHFREALSVIDLANMAGYETWWISNQQPMRATISSISHQADHPLYISNDFNGVEVNRYDTYLMERIKEALSSKAAKKAIFIHTMGSHAQYRNRYPEEFSVFKDQPPHGYRDDLSASETDAINEYDDSILFTDHFLQLVFAAAREAADRHTTITYFSDHGEEVYQSAPLKGHSPDNLTANMFEIPFIFWSSDAQQMEQARAHVHSAFMLDNLYQFAASVMGISGDGVEATASLLNPQYNAPQERVLYKTSYEHRLRANTPQG